FFQAEDGIRDRNVTGVQTCALPIFPPIYQRHNWETPAYSVPANSGLPSFQMLWWVCMPEPLSWNSGLGIRVTVLPWRLATFLMMYLYIIILSAIFVRESYRISIS